MINIEGKTFGRKQALFPTWKIDVDETDLPSTLRGLIECVVGEEIASFRERREERRFVRALTARQIAEGVERGKVDAGGREEPEGDVDDAQAVATAIQAFEDGLFYVFVDDVQIEKIDDPVRLEADSRVSFLRLVALAGG